MVYQRMLSVSVTPWSSCHQLLARPDPMLTPSLSASHTEFRISSQVNTRLGQALSCLLQERSQNKPKHTAI